MDEQAFDKVGREELSYLEDRLDDVDPDEIDYSTTDGVLTLELRGGTKVVINTHRAARQIWMAAVDTAWHFDYAEVDGVWKTPAGDELRPTLAKVIRDRIGMNLEL